MSKRKIHLNGLGLTLCGRDRWSMAKKFKDVTCKSCMKSWEYKQYLAGKFIEKTNDVKMSSKISREVKN